MKTPTAPEPPLPAVPAGSTDNGGEETPPSPQPAPYEISDPTVMPEGGEDGATRMVKNTLYRPEGKLPLILSYDDVNYYEYMLGNGFTYKLILGEDGKLWSWGLDPAGNEVVSRDLDAVTILDKFVEEHPDFSPFGAKGRERYMRFYDAKDIIDLEARPEREVGWLEAIATE